MYRTAFWVFTLSMTVVSFLPARADEQKNSVSAAPAASAASEPGMAKTADMDKKSGNAQASETEDMKLRGRTEKFRQQFKDNPYTDKLSASAEDMAKTLNDDQAHAFSKIRDGAMILHAVRVTVGDVGTAVASCGKNNPGLKNGMDGRFDGWKKDVNASLDKNDKSIDADINAGIAGEPKKVRSYLKLLDQWNTYNESQIEKPSATTEGACKSLQASMDKSGPEIIKQLESLKWPRPKARAESETKENDKAGGTSADQTEPAAGKKP